MTTTKTNRLLAPDLARGVMLLLIAMAYAGVYVGMGFGVDASGEPLIDRVASFFAVLLLDNHHRFHTAIGGAPISRINNLPGHDTSPVFERIASPLLPGSTSSASMPTSATKKDSSLP